MRLATRMAALAIALLLGMAPLARAQDAAKQPEKVQFLRVQRDERQRPVTLETSIVRYQTQPADGQKPVIVELISAVHVGDKTYYKQLNKEFEQYEVLLYELVAPEGARVPKGANSGHPVGAMQNGMSEMLELEHQLKIVDYGKKNFVHADMSPDEFSKSMADRDESLLKMMFKSMGYSMAKQSERGKQGNDLGLMLAFFSNDRALALKRAMAEQFENVDGQLALFGGPDGSTIITERNKKALEVLAKQIEAGKTNIGIFYGGGHMPDMEERLIKEFKMIRLDDHTRWLVAWDMKSSKPKSRTSDRPEGKQKEQAKPKEKAAAK